jgi:hypothetical protein
VGHRGYGMCALWVSIPVLSQLFMDLVISDIGHIFLIMQSRETSKSGMNLIEEGHTCSEMDRLLVTSSFNDMAGISGIR